MKSGLYFIRYMLYSNFLDKEELYSNIILRNNQSLRTGPTITQNRKKITQVSMKTQVSFLLMGLSVPQW